MRKEFKLNSKQDISIDDKHELYKDVLIAIISNQNINSIVKDTLIKNGYRYGIHYWHHDQTDLAKEYAFPVILYLGE